MGRSVPCVVWAQSGGHRVPLARTRTYWGAKRVARRARGVRPDVLVGIDLESAIRVTRV